MTMILNANSIVQHAVQIKNEIMTNVNTMAKGIMHAKKYIVGVLTHTVVRIVSI